MANIYVSSSLGSDAFNGTTWLLAKATLAGAGAIDAAGDTIWVSQTHAESVASIATAFAGTDANPVRVLCANDGAEPPTALATGGQVTVTGTTVGITGTVYMEGMLFIFSSASAHNDIIGSTTSTQHFRNCTFRETGGSSGSAIAFGEAGAGGGTSRVTLTDCKLRLSAAGQLIAINREVIIRGGNWESGGTSPTGIFNLAAAARAANLLVQGFDFSALSAGVNLVQGVAEGGAVALFRNCKLPASWSGLLVATAAIKRGIRVEMHNCDAGDTNYRLQIQDFAGTIVQETTIVRTGGATDGTTTFAWKLVTNANVAYPLDALRSPEVSRWNDTVGSAITVTVEVVTDNVTLTDAECWLRVQYLGTSGFPLALFIEDVKADVLATAAAQTSSSETWTTTGLTTPVKQKLAVTFTPQEKGFIQARVCLAKASTTVYVDPKLVLT